MSHEKVFNLTSTSVFTALLAIIAPISIPLAGFVPISLATLVICLFSAVLGLKRAVAGVAVYIMLGAVGIPVFSGYTAGLAILTGPTGGYIVGYLFMAGATGIFADKTKFPFVGMIIGTLITYILGTIWYAHVTGLTFIVALTSAVLPFVIIDGAKIAVSSVLAPIIKKALQKSKI